MELVKKIKESMALQIMLATGAGILFGGLAGSWASNLKFIGDIFLRLIQMSVVILVMTSMAMAVGGTEIKEVGKMSLYTFKWIFIFIVSFGLLGMILGLIIQPGAGISAAVGVDISKQTEVLPVQDMLVNLIPSNIIASMVKGDMVSCMIFAIFFGIGTGTFTKQSGSECMISWIRDMNAIIIRLVTMVMKGAPIGIFCLLADIAGTVGFTVLIPVIKFLGAMLIGDVIMFLIFCPFTAALCKVDVRKMPEKFMRLSVIALTTTSSLICLPVKIEDSVEKFGVSQRVADFTGPITMSMNACGAAMCHVLVVLFLSQSMGIALSPYQVCMALCLSCLMAVGNMGMPGGAVVPFTLLATSLGLPVEGISLLIGIDWFTGMFRTIANNDMSVLAAMLVADQLGELDRNVYNKASAAKAV
ncbi:dicarboxylate/amino acid:cation symporter [Lachnospiraceae bacterium 62-35]